MKSYDISFLEGDMEYRIALKYINVGNGNVKTLITDFPKPLRKKQ